MRQNLVFQILMPEEELIPKKCNMMQFLGIATRPTEEKCANSQKFSVDSCISFVHRV